MLNNDSRFDIDLEYGQISERELISALCGNITIEVKTERDSWVKTNNIAIEFESRGKKSGIAVTQAKYWCYVLKVGDEVKMMFWFSIQKLKQWLTKEYYNLKKTFGGDNNTSKLILVPINRLHEIAYEN